MDSVPPSSLARVATPPIPLTSHRHRRRQDRERICSLKQAMWTVYETKLGCIHPIANPIAPNPDAEKVGRLSAAEMAVWRIRIWCLAEPCAG